ncbi:MAG: hypothetical protein ABIJ16_08135 [Bacteroidota bacterium]
MQEKIGDESISILSGNLNPFDIVPSIYYIIIINALVVLSAFLLHRINFTHIIIEGRTYLPSILLVMILSAIEVNHNTFFILVSLNILLLFFMTILSLNKNQNNNTFLFNAAFLLAISAHFDYRIIYFFVFIFFVAKVLGDINLRNVIIALTGFCLPFIFSFLYYFLFRTADQYPVILYFTDQEFFSNIRISTDTGFLAGFILFTTFSLLLTLTKMSAKKIRQRKLHILMLWWLLFVCAAYMIIGFSMAGFIIYFSVPFAFFLTNFFNEFAGKKISSLIFYLLIIFVIFYKVFPYAEKLI